MKTIQDKVTELGLPVPSEALEGFIALELKFDEAIKLQTGQHLEYYWCGFLFGALKASSFSYVLVIAALLEKRGVPTQTLKKALLLMEKHEG